MSDGLSSTGACKSLTKLTLARGPRRVATNWSPLWQLFSAFRKVLATRRPERSASCILGVDFSNHSRLVFAQIRTPCITWWTNKMLLERAWKSRCGKQCYQKTNYDTSFQSLSTSHWSYCLSLPSTVSKKTRRRSLSAPWFIGTKSANCVSKT